MKKTIMLFAVLATLMMTACNPKESKDEELNYEGLIVGKWEVKTYYHMQHDFTADSSWEESYTLPDTTYVGYDSIAFNADRTSDWHMTDLYVSSGMFTDPYKHFSWVISDDTLIIGSQLKFAIKELNCENLAIEAYENNGHEEYGHHHLEQIHRYTLKRAQ